MSVVYDDESHRHFMSVVYDDESHTGSLCPWYMMMNHTGTLCLWYIDEAPLSPLISNPTTQTLQRCHSK